MASKPDWHRKIVAALQTEKKSIQWLITNSNNGRETFQLLHDLAELPNVYITSKNFPTVKSLIKKKIEKKCPIDLFVMIFPQRVDAQTICFMLQQLSFGMLIDCRIGPNECIFTPFNILIICESMPPIHVIQTFDVRVEAIDEYDRHMYETYVEPRVHVM